MSRILLRTKNRRIAHPVDFTFMVEIGLKEIEKDMFMCVFPFVFRLVQMASGGYCAVAHATNCVWT